MIYSKISSGSVSSIIEVGSASLRSRVGMACDGVGVVTLGIVTDCDCEYCHTFTLNH